MIEIRGIAEEGTLDAAYFNPRPINVAQAEWKIKSDRLQVYVEMDDVNYRGSNYTLDYFPDRDQLIGAYYQAHQQQSYQVEFIRYAE
jgi:hypothetical protein